MAGFADFLADPAITDATSLRAKIVERARKDWWDGDISQEIEDAMHGWSDEFTDFIRDHFWGPGEWLGNEIDQATNRRERDGQDRSNDEGDGDRDGGHEPGDQGDQGPSGPGMDWDGPA